MKSNKSRNKKSIEPEQIGPIPRGISYEGQIYDTILHAWLGRLIGTQSPASLGLALFDWLSHLGISPVKQTDILRQACQNSIRFLFTNIKLFLDNKDQSLQPPQSDDKRFRNDSWNQQPFSFYAQYFLLLEKMRYGMIYGIRGVSKHHEEVVNFCTRQMLDVFSPSNFFFTNPEVIEKTYQTMGANLVLGSKNIFDDLSHTILGLPPVGAEKFIPGINIAVTTGQVIYRNHLIELIQYQATTTKVYPEPILIIPAWIMKYYILDLSPHNSLVKYLVDKGHTVFMISWRNPTSEDRDLDFDSYIDLGIMDALDAINQITGIKKIHTVGYCLGGTLLMMAAAAMAAKNDQRIKSITLFAAQVDYRDPGELQLFIDQSQVAYLEDIMWERGYLDGPQMSWTFNMLQSNDLIWSRMIHDYLLGVRRPMNDLMAWNTDTTRIPYRIHSDYLHKLFLNNDLIQGRFKVNNKKIALSDIDVPIFEVSTLTDHISPWKSTYKLHLFADTEITFVLTTGGHNAGIVSEPGHPGRSYQILTRGPTAKHISPEIWLELAPKCKGSWWLAWHKWLKQLSGSKNSPPSMANREKGYTIICEAPGTYVFQK